MKHFMTMLCAVSVLLSVSAAPSTAAGLTVITTTQDLGAIVREVVGGRGTVIALAPGTKDPHYIAAKPSYMLKLHKADLLAYQGLQLEIGWLPKLLEGARNPALLPGRPGQLDASRAAPTILEVSASADAVSRAMGDVHPFGNPHYTLDPRNAGPIAAAVAERLGTLDPAHAADYTAAAEDFAARLQTRIGAWKAEAAPLTGLPVISYHKEWTYLWYWLGMEEVATVEPKPGIPPPPKHLVTLRDIIARRHVRILVNSTWHPQRAVDRLAEQTGARAVILPVSVGASPEATDYFAMFDEIIRLLTEATP